LAHEIRLRSRLDRRPKSRPAARRFEKGQCKTIFNDEAISGATTKRHSLPRCLKTLQEENIMAIGALAEGSSIRSIERMTGLHRETIMRRHGRS
jgi:hypothetical protein